MSYTNKYLQLSFFLLISYKNKTYYDVFNIRMEQMGVGDQFEQEAEPPRYIKTEIHVSGLPKVINEKKHIKMKANSGIMNAE